MNEDPFGSGIEETPREKQIRERAKTDAVEYVELMGEKSPDSIKIKPDGDLIINVVGSEGEIIVEKAKEDLNLKPKEVFFYLENLGRALNNLLLN